MGRVKKRSRSDGGGYVNVHAHGFHPPDGDVHHPLPAQAQYNSRPSLGYWEAGQLSFAL